MKYIKSEKSVQTDRGDMVYSQSAMDRTQSGVSTRTNYYSIPDESHSQSQSLSREWDPQGGKMSPARRTFCLFTTFDLILTFILWVIYTQLIGKTPIWKAFEDQVFNYTFQASLFDTVMISTARFTFIMLAYALFRISHWWVIAISTSMTCIYLLFKCFLFEFNDSLLGGKNPLSYIVLIVCFVLAWIETWMLDFKVVPTEKRLRHRTHHSDDEREPLLSHQRSDRYSVEDTREFYSPVNTPEGSEDEGDHLHGVQHGHSTHHHNHHHHHRRHHDQSSITSSTSRKASDASLYSVTSTISSADAEHYNQLLDEAKSALLEMISMDGWKLETGKNLQEGIIYSQNIKKFGRKIFKLQGVIDMAPHDLWQDMVNTLNDSPKWNPTILESRPLQVVDDCTEITYNIAAEGAGGLVSARDFVSLRQWMCYNNSMYLSVSISTTHSDMPPTKKYVRGDNGPGGWVFESVENEPDRCLFTWIVNTNLKGWLPQAAIDQAMSGVLVSYFKLLVDHYKEIIAQRTNGL
ncbi:steroidogenic acute regulatory protein-like isoform X1 [Mercenaria mercenaria]|uniref:steroidogenic acute regulatory protein-like isoform X1 n=2 Tax=Mercenaria mercenaria TaxID=6596 RepID=UPI00234F3813|nr:steroidogenic acute regulatory protein-like isoform X1 [Mercenaria mercenaria]